MRDRVGASGEAPLVAGVRSAEPRGFLPPCITGSNILDWLISGRERFNRRQQSHPAARVAQFAVGPVKSAPRRAVEWFMTNRHPA